MNNTKKINKLKEKERIKKMKFRVGSPSFYSEKPKLGFFAATEADKYHAQLFLRKPETGNPFSMSHPSAVLGTKGYVCGGSVCREAKWSI